MSELGQKIIAEVRAVAAEQPLFVFSGHCVYVQKGCPACLIGQALWRLGLISASTEGSPVNDDGIDTLLQYLDIRSELDDAEVAWLEDAQTCQDHHMTWQDAVREADERV